MIASIPITYQLDSPADIELAVYDALGRKLIVLDEGYRAAGEYEVEFAPSELASGVYYCVLELDGKSLRQRMILLS